MNTLQDAGQCPARRPLDEALDELTGAVDRADNSLDLLFDRLDPLIVRGHIVEGKPIMPAPSDRSAIVCDINSKIIKIEKLVERMADLYMRLDV